MKLSSFGTLAVLLQLDILTRHLLPLVFASCYFPNGTDRNVGLSGEIYHPCNGGDKNSMCCRTRDHDRCRSDGLCLNFQHNELWRESCTDPTWQSPECIKLCVFGVDEHGNQMVVSDERVTVCKNGSYCCGIGGGASQCCSLGRGVWIANGTATSKDPSKVAQTRSTSASLSPSTTATIRRTQSTRPPLPSSTASPPPSQSTSRFTPPPPSPPAAGTSYKRLATQIGGILGGVIALLLLTILVYLLVRCRRRRRTRIQHKKIDHSVGLSAGHPNPQQQQSFAPLKRPQAPAPERQRQRQLLDRVAVFPSGVVEIDGRVRPPEELDGRVLYEIGEGMVWVDRRRNAVLHMGF